MKTVPSVVPVILLTTTALPDLILNHIEIEYGVPTGTRIIS